MSEAIGATPSVTVFVDTESLKKTLSSDLFNRSDLHSLANSYNGNEIVCVKVDIKYGSRDDQKGSILVSARKADAGGKGRHVVVRTGLVLSSYSDRPFCKASNAIVRVQSDSLGSLLRRVETPSHSEWIPGDIDPYDCDCATELIAFVKTAHGALDRVLANLDTEEDVNIFSDLLPAGPRKPESVAESPFSIILEDDGQTFKIETAAQYNAGPNTSWRLQLTYDSVLGSGRARKGYRLGTFDLQQVPINVRSGKVKEKGNCHVEVSIADPSRFLMKIGPCGFAGWADVRFHAMRSDTGNIQ